MVDSTPTDTWSVSTESPITVRHVWVLMMQPYHRASSNCPTAAKSELQQDAWFAATSQ